jgi:flagellar biosynthesis protein FlhG
MSDQAAELRGLVRQFQGQREPVSQKTGRKSQPEAARIVAVTSGKGGVGKTNLVVNLAVALADAGMRVTILDADLGLANVDVLLGLTARHNLHHVINGTLSLADIILRGPHGVEVIPGASGLRDIADMKESTRNRFIESISDAVRDRDLLLIDTAAGVTRNVLDFVLAAQEVILLTVPEPTAMTDAYAMIKLISRSNPDAAVRVVVNLAPGRQEAESAVEQLNLLSRRFLNFSVDPLGYVPHDQSVVKAVRKRQPFVLAYPYSPASTAVTSIAANLRGLPAPSGYEPGVALFIRRLLRTPASDYLL